jgi:hypothetical protein
VVRAELKEEAVQTHEEDLEDHEEGWRILRSMRW